jgi:phospholipid/cholesterol/gamma-HCH transport system ATP-binding protein
MAAKPTLLLYDEPTTGLDPMTSLTVDAEIIKLRDLERVTSVLVTHQLRDAFYIATHEASLKEAGALKISPAAAQKVAEADFVMVRDGEISFEGSADELRSSTDPYLQAFLS